ncbi:MAG: formylglycine-generating enzyme family protein [Myxococcales bacterium]
MPRSLTSWGFLTFAFVPLACAATREPSPPPRVVPVVAASSSTSEVAAPVVPVAAACEQGKRTCDGDTVLECRGAERQVVLRCPKLERCDEGVCVPSCPAGEVYVAATGPEGFTMGRNRVRNGEDHPHTVVLTHAFCMDDTEVTAGAYEKCVDAGECTVPGIGDKWRTYKVHPDYPLNLVTWKKAQHYCEKQGKSLPTEAQWEWAATGGDGRVFPWGNDAPSCEFMDYAPEGAPKWSPGGNWGCHGGGPSAVKSHPRGARVLTTGKIYDLAGNVWEWTLDIYGSHSEEKQVDPVRQGKALVHTIRGGGWNRPAEGCNSWYRGGAVESYEVPGLGFRCVRNP